MKLKPETVSEFTNPSFVGKRQQHLYSTAETEINFTPKTDNEKAGLVIFQDEKHFYFIAKTQKEGKNVIQLIKSKDKTTEVIAEQSINAKKTVLKINSAGDIYNFYYSEDGKNWKNLQERVDGKFLSTKVSGGFIGCVYGLYATSSGEKSDNSASFKYLKYTGNDPMFK